MKRRVALSVVVVATVAACGSTATPSPTPTRTPAASVSTGPDPTPVPGGATAADSPALRIVAQNVAFSITDIVISAGSQAHIVLRNADQDVPHGFEVDDVSGTVVFKGDIIPGPADEEMVLPALKPGVYPFHCPVHPIMTGTITVR